jgi:LmbE family N-acetylglucosaminyl deacetylase
VLAVFAHPDDEVLCAAGTLALCAARGDDVTLVCATRGEYGPIADPSLATPETLAQVREAELRASCAALGVRHVELLGLPDGGVSWAAGEQNTLPALVRRIRRLRPRVVVTFGPDGLYGHADHVAVGALTAEARRLAADPSFHVPDAPALAAYHVPRLFMAVWTGELVRQLLAATTERGRAAQLWDLTAEQFALDASAITGSVDVRAVLERKLRALHSHRTQLTRDHALSMLSGELAQRFLGVEHFRCADGLAGDPLTCG